MEHSPSPTSDEPYDIMHILINPCYARTQITPEFFYKDESEIPHLVWFQDPIGTRFGIIVEKFLHNGFFKYGMWQILEHYNQPDGLWMQLEFNGHNTFFIIVQHLKGHKIAYPEPAITYPHDMEKLKDGASTRAPFVSPRDWSSFHQYHFKLSLFEITTKSLILSAEMHEELKYMGKPVYIKIIDEDRDQYECKVEWSTVNKDTYVVGECGKFYWKNGLKEDSEIIIGVDLCYVGWWYAKVISV